MGTLHGAAGSTRDGGNGNCIFLTLAVRPTICVSGEETAREKVRMDSYVLLFNFSNKYVNATL